MYHYNTTYIDSEVRNWLYLEINELYLDLRKLNAMPVKIWGKNYFEVWLSLNQVSNEWRINFFNALNNRLSK